MNMKARVDRLEQTTGDNDDVIVVTWGDGPDELVTVRGETMTVAEFERRYPDRKVIEWEDAPDVQVCALDYWV